MPNQPQGRTCSKCGSLSEDAEFCSECGAAMAAPAPDSAEACPVCGEARPSPSARYCDTCRYDFQTRQPFSAAAPAKPETAPATAPVAAQWDLHAAIDLSLRRPEDPEPADRRERIFPLDVADHLVGRRSDAQDIHPEVAINDPGISRRHLRLLRGTEGLVALDLGSMNGTRLNGAALEPNVPTLLREGDQITLGCWTRLTVRAR